MVTPTQPTAGTLASLSASIPSVTPSAPLVNNLDEVDGMMSLRRDQQPQQQDHRSEKDLELYPLPPQAGNKTPVQVYSSARLFAIAAVATCSMCMTSMGNVILTIALPTIQVDLGMQETDLQWLSSANSLTFGCFLLLSGRLADIHGRKLVFLVGVFWYAIWTLVGPFFGDGAGLIVSRALSGCGAALATPSAIGIIAANFHGRSRATAFAAFAAGAPLGGGLGFILGGVTTAYAPTTWKAALWITAALAGAIAVAAYFAFPPDVLTTTDRRVDWVGAALITIGLILLQFTVSSGETAPQGWKTPYIVALLPVGVILVAAFFFWERHVINNTSRPPLMRLALWTRARGRLAAVYMIGFVSWMGFVSLAYHATLFFQQVQGVGPVGAMLRFLPMCVSGVICNVIVAYFISRIPTQILICIGILATGIASVLFAVSPADVSYWRLPFNGMWMCVLGADFLMATATTFVSHLALPEEQSVAGALFQTLVQLGGAFGLALTTVIATSYQNKAASAGKSLEVARLSGIHAAFWLGAGCSFAALGVAVVALWGMGTIGKDKKPAGEGAPSTAQVEGDKV